MRLNMQWKCKRCNFEMVELNRNTIAKITKTLNPNFLSLPSNWKSSKSEWIRICPRCDSYALGLATDHAFPFRTKSGNKTTIHNLDFIKAHKHHNFRLEILKSEICGCFYCCQTFSPKKIFQWHGEDEQGVEQIAICPKCGIDSVIGSASGFPIEPTFLAVMRDFWFSPSEIAKTMGTTA